MKDQEVEKKNNDKTEKPIETPRPLPFKLESNPTLDDEPKTLLPHELNLARVRFFFFFQLALFDTFLFLLYTIKLKNLVAGGSS